MPSMLNRYHIFVYACMMAMRLPRHTKSPASRGSSKPNWADKRSAACEHEVFLGQEL